jgi:protein phosphatase PTC1
LRQKSFLIGDGGSKKRKQKISMPPWIALLHGYRVVEDQSFISGSDEADSVVAHRERTEELELWFFGVSNAQVGDRVTEYMQSHLFDRNPREVRLYIMLLYILLSLLCG